MVQRHSCPKKTVNAFLAFTSLFLSASFLSLNTFVVPVETFNKALTSVWSTGLGFASFVYAAWNLVTVGIFNVPSKIEDYHHIGSSTTKRSHRRLHPLTYRVRAASVPIAAVYLLLMLCIPALKWSSPTIMYAALTAQGAPYSFFYLLGVKALTAWFPESPATSMTLVSASYGLSQFLISPLFYFSISYFGLINSIIISSVIIFCSILLVVFLMDFPSEEALPTLTIADSEDRKCTSVDNYMKPRANTSSVANTINYQTDEFQIESEICPHEDPAKFSHSGLAQHQDGEREKETHRPAEVRGNRQCQSGSSSQNVDGTSSIPWYKLLQYRIFHKYLLITFMGRAAMALFPFYFKLGYLFGMATNRVVFAFQMLSLVSIAWALGINSLYEFLTKRLRRRSISKPFLSVIFILQAVLFAALIPLCNAGKATFSMVVISFLIVIIESQTALSVILAADLFGAKNSVAAYGLACGLSSGPGDAIFTYIMSVVEQKFSVGAVSTPASFSPFYWFCCTELLFGAMIVRSLE